MEKTYIIIPSKSIGGAEKRFVELWISLQKREREKNTTLLIPEKLYDQLINISEYNYLKNHPKVEFISIDDSSFWAKNRSLQKIIKKRKGKGNTYHFIMAHPIFTPLLLTNKTIFTITESSLSNINKKGQLILLLSALQAGKVDILDPKIHSQLSSWLPFKKNRLHLTASSAVDTETFKSVPYNKKENSIVFLGRFLELKQVVPLVKAIPYIDNYLKSKSVQDLKYYILGYGPQEEEIKKLVKKETYNDVNIEIRFEKNPKEILKKSKVFFSLQKNTNYPSKSLLEALSCENIPLVTDVGSTRKIALPEFSYYVDEYFTEKQLADELGKIFLQDENALKEKAMNARHFVKENHSIKKMVNYFLKLYS